MNDGKTCKTWRKKRTSAYGHCSPSRSVFHLPHTMEVLSVKLGLRGPAAMKLAERMSRIGVESAFDVLVRARALEAQGRNVIHLEIGEPDFPTRSHVVAAAKQAL